ncbi:YybS family protein [Peribacillus sp. SCS-37]|uniref:YybS family protein n=1 Tax=Paraperibacillus esterisolvens TaxID=3115296 RepID=UPI0039063E7F
MANGRKIAESAALLAVFCILVFLSIQLPVLGTLLLFILPLPFILVAGKHSLGWALGVLAAGTLVSSIIGTLLFAPVALLFGGTGVVIGYHIRKGSSFGTIYISSVLTFLIGFTGLFVFSIVFLEQNVLEATVEMFKDSLKQSSQLLEGLGQNPDEAMKRLNDSLDMLMVLAPSLFVVTSMVMVILILLAVTPIIKRLGRIGIKWPPIRNLQLPKSILWYYLIVLILSFFIDVSQKDTIYMVIVNILYVLQLLLLLQGYSLLFFYSRLKGWPKALTWFIVILSFLVPIFHYAVRILGIMDLGFKLRETLSKK